MEQRSRPGRAAPKDGLFASHDAASLASFLMDRGETKTSAPLAAAKALRHVHSQVEGVPDWSDERLSALGIGKNARRELLSLEVAPSLSIATAAPSEDGTMRWLLRARDGELIESVLIPAPGRTTLCVSSQVGCARACSFCETGKLGLRRQLSAGEIVDQVRIARAEHAKMTGLAPFINLVFMGMGEPFDNLNEVTRAIRLLTDGRTYNFAPARITVSTVGVADKVAAFFEGCNARLAVSLNAPDDERRSRIMPVNERCSLGELKSALLAHVPRGRGVLFEYVLFDGVNDALADADALAAYVSGVPCRVNLIACNPGPDPGLRPPKEGAVSAFFDRLMSLGVTTLYRRPRGRDVGGACGQLAGAARRQLAITIF